MQERRVWVEAGQPEARLDGFGRQRDRDRRAELHRKPGGKTADDGSVEQGVTPVASMDL